VGCAETAMQQTGGCPAPPLIGYRTFYGGLNPALACGPHPTFVVRRPVLIVVCSGRQSPDRPRGDSLSDHLSRRLGIAPLKPSTRRSTGYACLYSILVNSVLW
jgi:hypothetical protein